ncbi:MAG: GAF domain-containing protein, partial [Polyangiaceae bacterium]
MLFLGEPQRPLVTRFHQGDIPPRDIESDPLLSRWARARSLGVRADADAHPEGTTGADLAVRKDRLEAVFREESSLLAPLAEDLSQRNMLALVADSEGVILLARGGGGLATEAGRVRLVEGTRWSESARGTNAIGTAIAESRPVAVVGAAHFEERNHGLFCYATPIRDAYGDLVAVLDVTGAAPHHNPAVALAVHAAGAALERSLHQREYAAATPGGLAFIESLLSRAATPAMLVSASGAILSLNPLAAEALGVDTPQGLTAERVFGAPVRALESMALSPREGHARFETRRGRYRLDLTPLHGAGGRLLALVVYLEPERIRTVFTPLT